MKRTHSESDLEPYTCRQVKKENIVKNENNREVFTTLPYELLYLILSHSGLNYKNLNHMAVSCKFFNKYISSNDFGHPYLKDRKLEIKEGENWLKTYRLWLQTHCYILLDCSSSMDSYKNISKIVCKIADEVFNNCWRHGVTLGVFGVGYNLIHFKNGPEIAHYLKNLDAHLNESKICKTGTQILPLLKDVFDRLNTQNKENPSNSILHIISDCGFSETPEVIKLMKNTLFIQETQIKFHTVDGSKSFKNNFDKHIPKKDDSKLHKATVSFENVAKNLTNDANNSDDKDTGELFLDVFAGDGL